MENLTYMAMPLANLRSRQNAFCIVLQGVTRLRISPRTAQLLRAGRPPIELDSVTM